MYTLLFLAVGAFVLSLALTPLFRNVFLRLGWVDRPDSGRKIHRRPIPRAGGAPIALAYVAAFGAAMLAESAGGAMVRGHLGSIAKLLPAALLVLLLGLVDDVRGLKPREKFAVQFAAALLAWYAGVRIHSLAGVPIGEWLSVPLTLLWLVGCTNAFNLIDGLDGLATGIGILATLTILAAALLNGNLTLAYATAPLAGALLGFLRYNFNPASTFLGDSGSLTLGFLLGCFGIIWSQKSTTLVGITAPLMALAVPLFDTGLAMARRFLRGQSMFAADRGHIHHRLLDRGLSVRAVVLLLYGVCGLAAAFSLVASVLRNHHGLVLILPFCAIAGMGIHRLQYAEFAEARRVVFGGFLRRIIRDSLEIARLQCALSNGRSENERWSAIVAATQQLGLRGASLLMNGTHRQWARHEAAPPDCWQMVVPLGGPDALQLSVPFEGPLQPTTLARLADAIRAGLAGADSEPESVAAAPVSGEIPSAVHG